MATTRRLSARLSNLRIDAPPANSQIAVVQGESSASSSTDDDSPDPSPSKPRASRNMKKLSLTLPSSSSLSLQIPSEPQSAVSPTATARRMRRPSVMSLPAANPTPNSMLYRKEEEGGEAAAPYSDGPVQIIPGVWLGSEDNARDWKGLLERGIKSVLNVAKEVANPLDVNQHPLSLRTVASTPNFNKTTFSRQHIDDPTYVPSNPVTGRPPMHYLKLQWSHGQQDLVQSGFPDAMAFTDAALRREEGVLIHCQCGISRSATLVIALVMRAAAEQSPSVPPDVWALKGMQGAYSYVKDKSACVGPNMSLIYQLLDYEKALNKTSDSCGNSPGLAESGASSAADEEEWSRQRKLFEESSRSNDDEDDRESSAIRQEAEALDKAMEDRIVARKSSASSVNSTNSGVGMGAAWRSRYGHFPRKRAGSIASNMTTGSVLSEDLVEEDEEEELLGVGGGFDTEASTSSTTTSPEDDVDESHAQHIVVPPRIPHRYGSLGSKAMPSAPVWKTSFKLAAPPATAARSTFNIPPPPRTAIRSTFNIPPPPASANAKGKRRPAPIGILPPVPSSPIAIVVDSPTSSSNNTPAHSLPDTESTMPAVAPSPAPKRASSLSLPPVRTRTKSGKLPPPLHLRKSLVVNAASKVANLTVPDHMSALSTPSQTLFVFPPSPTSTLATASRTPSTMTLSNAPVPFPSLSTPRVSSFRAQGRTKSFIGLGSVPTPTTAFSKVDARGYVGLQ